MQRSMPRTIPLLVVVLAVQLGLAALLAARKNPLAATTPQTPLIGASVENVDHILIEGMPAAGAGADSARVELARKNGEWILPNYFGAPADKFKLDSVLDELAGLKRGLPIATTSSALKRFKLLDGDFERRLVLGGGGKTLSTVYFGSSAGVRRTDARTARDHAVYTVELATYELPTRNSDWLDADLLQRDPTSLTELDVSGAGPQSALKLVRQTPAPASATATATTPNAAAITAAAASAAPAPALAPTGADASAIWTDGTLAPGRQIDSAHVQTLAQAVAELHVDAILGLQNQPQWQQQHPVLTLGIRDSKHAGELATWTISKPSSGDYYVLKASSQPYYFRLSSASAKQLLDASTPAWLLVATAQRTTQPAATTGRGKAAHAGKRAHPRRPAA